MNNLEIVDLPGLVKVFILLNLINRIIFSYKKLTLLILRYYNIILKFAKIILY